MAQEEPSVGAGLAEDSPGAVPYRLSLWVRALVALGFTKVIAAVIMIYLAPGSPNPTAPWIPPGFVIAQLLAYGGTGAFLLMTHAHDRRTAYLGVTLTLVSSTFATGYAAELARRIPQLSMIAPLYPDAFFPYFVGQFVRAFPERHTHPRADSALRVLVMIAASTGWMLFGANALAGWSELESVGLLSLVQRRSTVGTIYWTTVFGLVFAILPLAFVGLGTVTPNDRRRVRLFWTAFLAAFTPTVLTVMLGAIPGFGPTVTRWAVSLRGQFVLQLPLVSLPVTVGYAVLVRQLLPWRVVVRRAVQYLLTRWTISAACIVPTTAVLVDAYLHRRETIADVFSGQLLWLLAGAGLAAVALFAREDLLHSIDRYFFREAYDARRVLVDLGEQIRGARRVDELVAWLTSGIDRALQPDATAVLVRDAKGEDFVSLFGSVEPLPASSVIAELLGPTSDPLDVQLDDPTSPLRLVPPAERQWLVDSRSRLLVPLHSSEQILVGLITLAERKSELPYSQEDRWLLSAIADAGALTIENHAIRRGPVEASDWWHVGLTPRHGRAAECPDCGTVYSPDRRSCLECGTTLGPSEIPEVLFGKFRFETRVGRGAMGIVYRARDLALERVVAIKTLPGTSPEHAQRLRLEAKTMAAVMHRNLALIYGVESWRGRPMLVCEFMSHGTLAERLANGRVPWPEALSLGVSLAEALHVIHSAGLLHRDLKPTNIGYAQDGVPKLLDFGLVYLLSQAQPSEMGTPIRGAEASVDQSALSMSRRLVGTPLYLSPEACLGHRPNVSFDLWSLNVLLLEVVAGRHPFRGETLDETLDRIQQGPVRGTFDGLEHCPRSLVDYFARGLSSEIHDRPASAQQLAESLRAIARRP